MNSSYIKSFAVDKLYTGGGGAKTLATPVDSLATGFDLKANRRWWRRRMAAAAGSYIVAVADNSLTAAMCH